MSMKIDGRILTNKTGSVSSSKKTKKKGQVNSSDNESALVSLSDVSDAIQSEINSSEVPFDEVKVQEIKNAISEGRFSINTEAIAEGILNMAFDLVSAKNK